MADKKMVNKDEYFIGSAEKKKNSILSNQMPQFKMFFIQKNFLNFNSDAINCCCLLIVLPVKIKILESRLFCLPYQKRDDNIY